MLPKEYSFSRQISELREREKELRCLYKVEEAIGEDLDFEAFFYRIIGLIPNGWQFPAVCKALIRYEGVIYKESGWDETEWKHHAEIEVDNKVEGRIEVFYTRHRKFHQASPFLQEEQRLLKTIARRIGDYIFSKKLVNSIEVLKKEHNRTEDFPAEIISGQSDTHWKWRLSMVQAIAEKADFKMFGIKGIYLIGSTKEATAGPASDIDLLIHVDDESFNRVAFLSWLDGWSLSLAEVNFKRTGYKSDGLIDIHLVTDNDIKNKTSYAVMIGSLHNRAKPIKVIQ